MQTLRFIALYGSIELYKELGKLTEIGESDTIPLSPLPCLTKLRQQSCIMSFLFRRYAISSRKS